MPKAKKTTTEQAKSTPIEQEEKFETVGELHKVFAQKFGQYEAEISELKSRLAVMDEKFATIGEFHKLFADKFLANKK